MPADARRDAQEHVAFIHEVVRKTDQRVDPHAFHYVHWGAIVLVWYPLSTWLQSRGHVTAMIVVGVVSFVGGMVLSMLRELRLKRIPRVLGENTYLSNQLAWITVVFIGAGIVLSAVGPASGFIDGLHVPTVWGLIYAAMASTIGVVYRRAFLVSGGVIFATAITAMFLPHINGYILGPAMGLGMIIPGRQAEARVRALGQEV